MAEMVFINGNVITVDPKRPRAEAVAVENGRIAAVGSTDEVRGLIGEGTRVVDLGGRTLLPGFIDCHVHFVSHGLVMKTWLDASKVTSIAELVELVRRRVAATPKGGWVRGRGFEAAEHLAEKRWPTRWDLDPVSPDNPVAIEDYSGSVMLCNSRALALAGVTRESQLHPRDRDPASGEPNGQIRWRALRRVMDRLPPPPTDEQIYEAIKMSCWEAVRLGLTSVHNVRTSLPGDRPYDSNQPRAWFRLWKEGGLPLRAWLMFEPYAARTPGDSENLDHLIGVGVTTGFGDDMLKIGNVKIIADGSFWPGTALMYEPFADDPTTTGEIIPDLKELVLKAHRAGFQLEIHCLGDKGTDMVLDAYEEAITKIPRKDHRHRIVHAPLAGTDERIERMLRLGLILNVTGANVRSPRDQEMYRRRLGPERSKLLLRHRTAMKRGVTIISGSDCQPCALWRYTPLWSIYHLVANGPPDERFTVEEAIRIYTINGAYGSFEEEVKGSIEVGKYADLVVLSESPLEVPAERIPQIEVELTMVGGRIVYDRAVEGSGNPSGDCSCCD